MADRQTGSVWTHLEGAAIQGDLAGRRMAVILILHTTWGEWVDLHPDTTVLDPDTPFWSQYRAVTVGRSGLGLQFVQSLLAWDSRLPESTVVVGVTAGGVSRAYALGILPDGLGVINDTLGELPIVVLHDRGKTFGIVYSRTVDGEVLTFGMVSGSIVDDQTGSTWNVEGVAVDGPLAGRRLAFVTSFITEWYGWSAFHPDTEIHREAETQARLGVGAATPVAGRDPYEAFGRRSR